MKRVALLLAFVVGTTTVLADDAAKNEVQQAAKKLQEKGNYSWTTTSQSANQQQQGRFGPTEGKTEKGGFTSINMTFGDNTLEAIMKDGKGAVKTPEGWRSISEVSEGEGPGRFVGRLLQMKPPADQIGELAGKVKELKKDGDAYTGQLTEEDIGALSPFGRRGNNNNNNAGGGLRNASGTVKIWVKDGVLSKYQYNIKGTASFNNNDVEIDRTTTVEIKDVDSTKVTIPEEAKSKIS